MQRTHRRSFLKQLAAGTAAAQFPTLAGAAPWACTAPANCGTGGLKVLEIFCYGGLSQWENFWVSEDAGIGINWRGAEDEVSALDWSGCSNAPTTPTETAYFADAGGSDTTPVHWGPATRPLWPFRPYVRAVVVKPGNSSGGVHALDIHKGLTGRRIGDPRAAGLGAAIQHQALSAAAQDLPYAYVLSPKEAGDFGYVVNHATAPGQHPGSAVPLSVRLGGSGFDALLARDGMSAERDVLLGHLKSQYRNLLRYQGMGAPVHSGDFISFDAASDYARTAAAELDQRIGGEALTLEPGVACALHPELPRSVNDNSTRRSLELAAYLLRHAGARYVGVLDGGIQRVNGDSPYDTHGSTDTDGNPTYSQVQVSSANLWNLLDALTDIIEPPATPPPPTVSGWFKTETVGEEALIVPGSPPAFNGEARISLSNTLIIINTEFNRTPERGSDLGREHSHSSGHVALLMGGPVAGGSIAGRIGLAGGEAQSAVPADFATPTDVHAAVLDAMGIDVWADENFRTTDAFSPTTKPTDGTSQSTIRNNIRNHVLGA